MCLFVGKRYAKELKKENEYQNQKIKELQDAINRIDMQFQQWKEEVLSFEHSDSCIDIDPSDDNRVLDGECVRSGEDEDDI